MTSPVDEGLGLIVGCEASLYVRRGLGFGGLLFEGGPWDLLLALAGAASCRFLVKSSETIFRGVPCGGMARAEKLIPASKDTRQRMLPKM
jgi:hypothetical protein